jgi:putative hydrolase of the HAD superfamily
MQLKAIIFDYGGVLCTHPPDQQVRDLASLCRLEDEQFLQGYWSLRATYDNGDLDAREYWTEIGRPWGQVYTDADIDLFRQGDIGFWVHLHPGMMDWVRRVRAAGIPTGLLSNLPLDLGEYLRDDMRLTANFDHHTFSYELRVSKPEPGIYRHAVEGLGVEPGEALFIDDRAENVEGARRFGLQALQFESPRKLAGQLTDLAGVTGCRVPFGTPPIFVE